MMYRATSKSVINIASRCTRLSAKKLTLPNHYAPSVFRYAYHHFSSSSSVNPAAVDIATAGGDMASSDISDLVAVTVDTPRSDEIITHGADAAPSNISSLANTPIDGCVVIDAIAEISPYENPTHIVMYVVDQIHHFAGIPYWEAIMITTLMLRITLVPAAIVLLRDVTKLKMLRSEIKGIKESFNGVTAAEDPTIRFKYLAKIKELFIINKLNPLQTAFLSVLQFPIFLYVFLGLRSMGTYFPEFSSGGALWFTDLSVPDPYFLLPALNACSFLLMVEISSDGPQTEQQKSIKNTLRGLALAIGPCTYAVPQGVFIYWITSNFFSLGQSVTLKDPEIRKYFGIGTIPLEAAIKIETAAAPESLEKSSKELQNK